MDARRTFGRFDLQPAAQRLLVDGRPVAVGPRALDVLVALTERAGELVTKTELLERVWPGLVVEENNLQVQVSSLRRILGPEAIATVPGRGYRFTLQVQPGDPAPAPSPGNPPAPTGAEAPSIAVLPFVNMSDDAANEYFADGLSEELLNVLSKIRGLRVASRTSAFSFKGANADIPTVARKLNVATILEGSVRKAGSRVRIAAQLVHVATDSHLWSQTYDRELDDIFAVQDDIACSVVEGMRAALMRGGRPAALEGATVTAEVRAAVKGRSSNAEAYRLYLQGSFFANRYNEDDEAKAIAFLRRALDLDPDYALAWALLSTCYLGQGANAWAPFAEGAKRARDAAERALALEPELAAGHSALAAVRMFGDWDWKAAEASIRRGLQLAPEDARLAVLAAGLLQNLGRDEEAEPLVRRALALDPLNVDAHTMSGWLHTSAGRLAEAESAYRSALELTPQRARIHSHLCDLHLLQGRYDDALREAGREVDGTFRLQGIALVELARGNTALADAALQELIRESADGAAYQVAQVHAKRGDDESAFEWLERAWRQHDAGLASMKVDPLLNGLHGDPRWRQLLEKMGFAE